MPIIPLSNYENMVNETADLRRQVEDAKAESDAVSDHLQLVLRDLVDTEDQLATLTAENERLKNQLEETKRYIAGKSAYAALEAENERLKGYAVGKCERCLHVYVGHGLGAGCAHCELERLREAANELLNYIDYGNDWNTSKRLAANLRAALEGEGG